MAHMNEGRRVHEVYVLQGKAIGLCVETVPMVCLCGEGRVIGMHMEGPILMISMCRVGRASNICVEDAEPMLHVCEGQSPCCMSIRGRTHYVPVRSRQIHDLCGVGRAQDVCM